jgi:threonyl-tRNA synthetase
MIHRALMGSIERFFGILIEHYAGVFPTWLAPIQVLALSITDRQRGLVESIVEQLKAAGLRAEADVRNEKIGFKIREAEKAKVPYMLVVGDREMEGGTVSVRGRSGANLGVLSVPKVIEMIAADRPPTLNTH